MPIVFKIEIEIKEVIHTRLQLYKINKNLILLNYYIVCSYRLSYNICLYMCEQMHVRIY